MGFSKDKIQSFAIGTSGIYFSFLYYGFLQEKIFKNIYQDDQGNFSKSFSSVSIFLFFQLLICTLVATAFKFYKKEYQNQIPFDYQINMSVLNMISLFLGNQALLYVSFPFQALIKSAKVLSVLFTSIVFGGKKFVLSEIFQPLLITLGIFLFNTDKKDSKNVDTSLIGMVMLFTSLFCDGVLALQQTKLREIQYDLKWEDLMQKYLLQVYLQNYNICACISFFGSIISFIIALILGDFIQFFEFVSKFPQFIIDLTTISLASCFGQLFIFYTIQKLGPYILSIITTTRKFFTVIFSIIIFGHSLNNIQILSLILVFFGLFLELYQGSQKQKKVKN